MTTRVTAQIETHLTWKLVESIPGSYVAVCDPIRLTVFGETYEKLKENIEETLQLLFEDLVEENGLDQFLRELGYS